MPEVSDIINVGFSLHQEGKLDDAENAYNEALKADSDNAEVMNLIGILKLQKGEIDAAIEYIESAVQKRPESYFFETLFQAYIRKNDYEKIVSKQDLVLKLFPNNFSLLFNLAFAHKNLKDNKAAIHFYEKALEIDPTNYKAWFNLANLYSTEAETKNAVSALKVCKKLMPNDDEIEYFLGIALMRTKNYADGLKYFEKRLARTAAISIQKKTYPNKVREDNLWKGENIKDKILLVYYEAGFGDAIMFSRYLPLARKKCKKLIFISHKQLSPLFRENKHLGIDQILDTFVPESELNFDVHAPLLSLPYLLGLKKDDVFVYPQGYLGVNPEKIKEYKQKYFNTNKVKIGIKWQGNTTIETDRVIPTEKFVPLTSIGNTQFYSFQTFEGSEETSKLENVIDVGQDLIDFAQTAAALSNLELVICNDTSLAHLAGALGIPCWIILPYDVNWRWHEDLSKCDWYDSVKLFRQKSQDSWDEVFAEVKKEIESALTSL